MEAVLEKPRAVILQPSRMRESEYERTDYCATAELGTRLQDILKPEYWAHCAAQFKPYDHIEVRVDDGSWIAFLLVLQSERNWAKVFLISSHDLTGVDVKEVAPEEYLIEWKGPQHKWSVIRNADKEMVKTKCADKDEAQTWLKQHLRAVG